MKLIIDITWALGGNSLHARMMKCAGMTIAALIFGMPIRASNAQELRQPKLNIAYKIIAKHSGKCFDCHKQDHQLWKLEEVNPALPSNSPIQAKYNELGRAKGFLGKPATEERATPDGIGKFRHFAGGSIYWHPKTGAHEVRGDIRKKWSELGWEKSFLGYPTTDETPLSGDKVGRFNHFQGGSIYWHPQTGVRVERGNSRK
ncbi:MAG: hypothetical protein ACREOI_34085 [bacterium]